MRNPNRLDRFYDDIKLLHKEYFPDLRFGQLFTNFLGWVLYEKKRDPFFIEESTMIDYFKEYCGLIK